MSKLAQKPASASRKQKPGQGRKRPSGRGVLWLIALLLLTSGLARLGGNTGQAIARELTSLSTGAEVQETSLENSPQECRDEADITEVLARLQSREAQLRQRESALEDRSQALAVAEAQIALNMEALAEAERALESTIGRASTAAEDDLTRLTAVYENMKPKDATPLFAAMDPEFAAGFLGRMRADAAAAILSGLDPEMAYAISVILAGRNANAPTD